MLKFLKWCLSGEQMKEVHWRVWWTCQSETQRHRHSHLLLQLCEQNRGVDTHQCPCWAFLREITTPMTISKCFFFLSNSHLNNPTTVRLLLPYQRIAAQSQPVVLFVVAGGVALSLASVMGRPHCIYWIMWGIKTRIRPLDRRQRGGCFGVSIARAPLGCTRVPACVWTGEWHACVHDSAAARPVADARLTWCISKLWTRTFKHEPFLLYAGKVQKLLKLLRYWNVFFLFCFFLENLKMKATTNLWCKSLLLLNFHLSYVHLWVICIR